LYGRDCLHRGIEHFQTFFVKCELADAALCDYNIFAAQKILYVAIRKLVVLGLRHHSQDRATWISHMRRHPLRIVMFLDATYEAVELVDI
jgi:hypothetical protein